MGGLPSGKMLVANFIFFCCLIRFSAAFVLCVTMHWMNHHNGWGRFFISYCYFIISHLNFCHIFKPVWISITPNNQLERCTITVLCTTSCIGDLQIIPQSTNHMSFFCPFHRLSRCKSLFWDHWCIWQTQQMRKFKKLDTALKMWNIVWQKKDKTEVFVCGKWLLMKAALTFFG